MIHKKFKEVWPAEPGFTSEYKTSAFYLSEIADAKISLIYYLLYARYGGSTISSHDEDQFKAKLFLIIYQYAPLWIKRSAMQAEVRQLNIEDAQAGGLNIVNRASNPETSPETDALDPLGYINEQTVNGNKKSVPAAIATILELLSTDYTEEFLQKFKKLFLVIVPGSFCELPEPSPSIVEGINVKSTGIAAGKVLTADGDGGASWEDAGDGDVKASGSLNVGDVVVGLGGKTVGSITGANGKILGWNGGAVWIDNKIEETGVPGEVAINEGMTVNSNGDVDVGRNLVVDGSVNIHGGIYLAGILTTGQEIDLTGQGFRQFKDANHVTLKLGNDQINTDGIASGKVLTADGSGGSSWEDAGKKLYRYVVDIQDNAGTPVGHCICNIITTYNLTLTPIGKDDFADLLQHVHATTFSTAVLANGLVLKSGGGYVEAVGVFVQSGVPKVYARSTFNTPCSTFDFNSSNGFYINKFVV